MTGIILEDVSVDFPIYGSHRSLRNIIFQRAAAGWRGPGGRDRAVVTALRDVSLRLRDGDRLGLIGHNGAGKSTLLRVMAGIYEPTKGRVLADGKIAILSRAMPGLDPEDDGYGNISIGGMFLRMSRKQIASRLPAIEEFSGLGDFLSLPVRTYSAGMVTKLGLALTTTVDAGILLIDESIAAGDAEFTARAIARMAEVVARSGILVLATHSTELLTSMCNTVAILQGGRIAAVGAVDEMLERYADMSRGARAPMRDGKSV
jgi:ABC-type polysaccharide/polyol phosphate transport system ATPase subunit